MSPDTNVLTVQLDSADSSLAWASLGEKRWRCVIGAGGVREDKVEGDAATPARAYPLRHIYFRTDLLELVTLLGPETRLNVLSLSTAEQKPTRQSDDEDVKQFEDFDEKDW